MYTSNHMFERHDSSSRRHVIPALLVPRCERSADVWVTNWTQRVLIKADREPQLDIVMADVAPLSARAVSHVDEHMVP